jgi:mono/diheme cytochrome c family protein
VLAPDRALVLRGGTLAATIPAPHRWRAGATIAALDGEGAWAVGVDDSGRLYRITLAGDLEDITDRFRISGIRAVAAGGTTTVFGLPDGVAVTGDGLHELRAELAGPEALAASKGRIALTGAQGVVVWDLDRQRAQTYPVHARAVALAGGRLAVAEADRVLVEEGHAADRSPGDRAAPAAADRSHADRSPADRGAARTLHALPLAATQLAAAGSRLWILADGLYALDGESLQRARVAVPAAARLFGAPNGDVFLAADGRVERISIDAAADDPAWRANVQPVFARVCAHCHLPGGDAGIDLSTAAAWRGEHAELVRRVLVTRTMPPAGTDLSPSDRDALARWLTSPSAAGPSTGR